MLNIIKQLKLKEYVLFAIMILFIVVQIYCDVTLPIYTAEIVAKMQAGEEAASILATGGIMLIYAAISLLTNVVQTFLSAKISTSVAERLRQKVFDKVMGLSAQDINRFTTSSLITRTTNDIQQVCSVLVLGLRMGLGAPLMAIFAIIRIAQSGVELTVATAIGVFILLVGIIAIMLVVTPKFALVQRLTDRLNGVTRENLTGIRVVRAFNAEKYEESKFNEVNKDLTKTHLFTGRMTAILHPLISAVSYGVTLAIYWIGCYIIISRNDAAFFPTMFSYTQLSAQVIMAFMMILMLLSWLPRAMISAKRINEVLNCNSIISEPEQPEQFKEDGSIEFRNVNFGYAGDDKVVLKNISFSVNKGETIAIIGATGCGKTTLLSLIERYYDCTSGEVLVNGVNVKSLSTQALRNIIGYVPQRSLLFSGTIGENISFFDDQPDNGRIEKSAHIACADFVESLEQGYNSFVSQGGKNLSGGQKQRLCIARAVYSQPQIFLFDDCFSALDYATDAKVRANLKTMLPDSTKIIVAQRIGTVRDADKIIVLSEGQAVGIGKHFELLKTCEVYRRIALSQLSAEELGL